MKNIDIIKYSVILFIATVFLSTVNGVFAQPNLKAVLPLHGANNTMRLIWTAVPGAQAYAYQKKVNAGVYPAAWDSVGNVLDVTDNGPFNSDSLYTYHVRAMVGGVWFVPSNERANKFKQVWPVAQGAACNTEGVELLHNFGQPLEVGGGYLHEGVDIHGTSNFASECVKSPLGAYVLEATGAGSNIHVNLQVFWDGAFKFIQFNHLKNLEATLVAGETIKPGDKLGLIKEGIWSTLGSHTHFH